MPNVPPAVRVDILGLEDIEAALHRMGGPFLPRLLGPSLGAAAGVVRDKVKRTRNYGFTDRRGRRRSRARGAGGKYTSLRRSLRTGRIPAEYGGRKYRQGRAAVYAGGSGARQAYLVEEGHGGPYPAPPHPYLFRALEETEADQAAAFARKARERFPRLAMQFAARSNLGSVGTLSRTIARHHRGR